MFINMKTTIVPTCLLGLVSVVLGGQIPSYGSPAPSVTIKNGTIAGVHSDTYNQDFFLGVPFALPPVNELRFRNPQSINSTFNSTYQATEYAPECFGYGGDQIGYPQSEDCLYLNVIRPSGYENVSLPVGVWIHGGGLFEGGTRDLRYNLSFIVENSVEIGKPIMAVSIAYRLGPWGFLSSQEVSGSGNTNIGLRDQRLALHWINENIAAFGGNKSKVTIWGESAGAGSVGWHLTAYNGRNDGLFSAGIMESGNVVSYSSYQNNAHYQPLYDQILNGTNCTNALDNLDCLRHAPLDTLQYLFYANDDALGTAWEPVVDGDFIQKWGSIQLAEGNFVKVPIIVGANTDEGTAFSPTPVASEKAFEGWVTNTSEAISLTEYWVPEVLAAYPDVPDYYIPPIADLPVNYTVPASYGADYRRSAAYFGDAVMIANRRGASEAWAANGLAAYSYRFNTVPANVSALIGATHFQEVAFVFDNTMGLGYNAEHDSVNPFQDKPKSYYELAGLMSKSWASFIHDSNPNGFKGRYPGAPDWPVYDLKTPQNIVWDANVTTLAVAEADTFRAEGIRWILDHALAYRR